MTLTYTIENTTQSDLEFIYHLFESAIAYQKEKNYPVWRGYDKDALNRDIENKNQYKVVIDSQTTMIFSVFYSDKDIWREKENGDAVYLHRVVVNPLFKGRNLFREILSWTIEHANQLGKKFVRLDTWADNPQMIEFYKSFEFYFIENCITNDSPALASQNRNLNVALLELKLN